MGTENPGQPNFPMRPSSTPFASAPPTVRPFSSYGPVTGSESSNFRPTPLGAPPNMTSFSTPGPSPPGRFSDPSVPSPPIKSVPPYGVPYQQFPTHPFPSATQIPPNRAPLVGQPPFQPPASQVSVPPPFFRPHTQVPLVPMGSPPQNKKFPPCSMNVPQPPSDLSISGPRPNFQPPFPGYPNKQPAVSQAPPPFPTLQGSFMPPRAMPSPFPNQQGSYGPPPPVASNLGYQSRDQMQHPGSAPPIGVPGEYFANFDSTGRRIDLDQRSELIKGSVEFVAPTEYMVRPPMPPLYFFLIDVSISAVRSGMIEMMSATSSTTLEITSNPKKFYGSAAQSEGNLVMKEPEAVKTADGSLCKIEGHGTVILNDKIVLKNVLFVPNLACNLVSELNSKKMIGKASLQNSLYILPASTKTEISKSFTALEKIDNVML
ncbi:Detected protein of confused Function [Hibiscus syriacus]|uniref:Detected protein of confused Function n=1 Tax=Hibiscus syriacus TaxID=106335 RepID=A0A6A2ZH30_HIBSY|nr:Detected protein of confused Function [Hibiscus syriacus]